jgi:hypothetical protein
VYYYIPILIGKAVVGAFHGLASAGVAHTPALSSTAHGAIHNVGSSVAFTALEHVGTASTAPAVSAGVGHVTVAVMPHVSHAAGAAGAGSGGSVALPKVFTQAHELDAAFGVASVKLAEPVGNAIVSRVERVAGQVSAA